MLEQRATLGDEARLLGEQGDQRGGERGILDAGRLAQSGGHGHERRQGRVPAVRGAPEAVEAAGRGVVVAETSGERVVGCRAVGAGCGHAASSSPRRIL
ncbi:hypothetical protein BFL36_02880 [Clavibacter michiganensis]|uniref:Uncharacterized protein n=1 Tax=Clavibacter michiganensis TaxID=28447 RepID=A0A251YT81_9MICO|nr:hypothetical protein BFL36_02880 [Clavibacter michiganensis]